MLPSRRRSGFARALALRVLVAACAATAVQLPGAASAGDPALIWSSIDTAHFTISYHTGLERVARRVAVIAEDAHDKLVPKLGHAPRHRTQVLVTDITDDSNGSATVLPYAALRIFATAPDDRSELNDYDDWLSSLFIHEYAHIIHLDTMSGVARVINAILGFGEHGYVYAPNQVQPRFIIEGLAVFEETERTSGGRLRSAIFDMYLRTAVLGGKALRLDEVANGPARWPRGNAPYLYGSAFLRFITRRYGEDVLRRMSHHYGRGVVPWGINRAMFNATGGRKGGGRTLTDLYPEFQADLRRRYRAQLDSVIAKGLVEGEPITDAREYAARPFFTPDGREIVWTDSDLVSRARLSALAVDAPVVAWKGVDRFGMRSQFARGAVRPRAFYVKDAITGSAISRDARTLYLSAVEVHRTNYYFNDLFEVDRPSGRSRQLTHGLRASEPDLSVDGTRLVFTVNEQGARSLYTLAVDPTSDDGLARGAEPVRVIGNTDDLSQIYTPAFSPDGRHVAFSWHKEGGFRDIWIVDLETGRLERLTADRALDIDPRFSPDGRFVYFSSDRSGIYNLYAHELSTGRLFQVTNVVGGVFDVAISPDGRTAAYVDFSGEGFYMARLGLDPARFRPAPEVPDAWAVERPEADVPAGSREELVPRPFLAAETAWPRTWMINSYPDAFGQTIALNVAGADIAGNHSWQASIGASTGRPDAVSASASYQYNRFFPSFGLSASRSLTRRGGFYADGINYAYVEEDWAANAGVSLPVLRRINMNSDLGFNYNFVYLDNRDRGRIPLDPNLISPRLPETGRVASLGISWNFSMLRRFTLSVSPEQGRAFGVSAGLSYRGIGSEYDVATLTWRYQEFVPTPFRAHSLYLGYSGGISGGDINRRGAFYLGGYGAQADVLRALFDFSRPGGGNLRGYAPGSITGNQYHLFNVEYRFPIAWIERGFETLPFYFRRLHGAAFLDTGAAFSGTFDPATWRAGVGAEIRLEILVGYYIPASFQLGYARGLTEGGADQVYFLLNNAY